MKKKLLAIPKFKSIAEEAEFWDIHDSEDYEWKEAKNVRFAKNLISVYKKVVPIRFDDETKEAIKKIAREKAVSISDTARVLIRERLIQLKAI